MLKYTRSSSHRVLISHLLKCTLSADTKEVTKFKPLLIPGLTITETDRTTSYRPKYSELYEQKVEDEDWTRVWPCENIFTPALFPIPIRQGHSKNLVENGGLSPGKYTNTELMKIPNFLHLTPAHIRKHCDALKKFTTKWPAGLSTDGAIEEHYPLEVVHRTYVNSAPSIRDPRARKVTIKVPLTVLNLDRRSRLKLLRLAKSYGFERGMAQFYSDTEILELTSERCPARHQNYDYLTYVLTVLTMESKKREKWEDTDTGSYLDFEWSSSPHRKRLYRLLFKGSDKPSSIRISDEPTAVETTVQKVDQLEEDGIVQQYRGALEKMFSTACEELCGPWHQVKPPPRRRHYHWPHILHPPLEPVHGADIIANLNEYAVAVRKLWSLDAN